MSLRREKAARLKAQIFQNTLKLVGKKSFEDLYVEDLCDKVRVSKVTFFKYFPKKEDVLLYYFRIWCLNCSVALKEEKKEGLQGIHFLFDQLMEDYERYPGMWQSLIGYLSDLKRPPKPYPVKMEEKTFLFPDVPDINSIEILAIDQMIEQFVLEAIFRKEITRTSSTRDVTNLLLSVFFGSLVTVHVNQLNPGLFFKKNLEGVIRGLS